MSAEDRYLSLTLEGVLLPTSYHQEQTLTTSAGASVNRTGDGQTQNSYRFGVTALGRIAPESLITPAVGLSYGRCRFTEGDDTSSMRTTTNTWDLLGGISLVVNPHVMIDILPFMGIGRGQGVYELANGTTTESWSPNATVREYGLRGGVTFISYHGMTLSLFGGVQKIIIDYEGDHAVTASSVTTMYDHRETQRLTGGFAGLGWGFTF
jgi:hypothetical protein